MEKVWKPENPSPQYLAPAFSIVLGLFALSGTLLTQGFQSSDVLFLVLATILLTYGFGKLYGEITLNKNYIKVSETGIEFREAPVLGLGWIPITRNIKFDDIKNIDLVEIKSPLLPNQPYLMIAAKSGKSYIIGRNYSPNQLQTIAVGLSGATTLTNKLLAFINKTTGKTYKIDEIINFGKNILSTLKEQKKEASKNNSDDEEDDGDYIIVE